MLDRQRCLVCLALIVTSLNWHCFAEHACDAEVQSACPDRPGSETAKCLKDKSEHESPTEISSDCSDFIALNMACADDISKHCDDAYFSQDTTLCLTEWTQEENLAPKCNSVLKWAAPRKAENEVTDELGMTEKDRREKAEWQAKRRSGRSAAVDKMREDLRTEKELDDLKEDPEAYEQLVKDREEARKNVEEMKKRQRLMKAAEERKQKQKTGEKEESDEERRKREKIEARMDALRKGKTNWLPYAIGAIALAYIIANIMNWKSSRTEKDKPE